MTSSMRSAIVGGGVGAGISGSAATPSGPEAPMNVWLTLELEPSASAVPIQPEAKLDQYRWPELTAIPVAFHPVDEVTVGPRSVGEVGLPDLSLEEVGPVDVGVIDRHPFGTQQVGACGDETQVDIGARHVCTRNRLRDWQAIVQYRWALSAAIRLAGLAPVMKFWFTLGRAVKVRPPDRTGVGIRPEDAGAVDRHPRGPVEARDEGLVHARAVYAGAPDHIGIGDGPST